jgi:serine/threonine-protein kinase
MYADISIDHELLDRLPLPLAQLCRRAQNAKTPLERHLAAFYLWEASLRLLASAAVIEYAGSNRNVDDLDERLRNLARPSLGHWWEFVRRLVPVLAENDAHFERVRDLVLGRQRDDMPGAAGLQAALSDVLTDRDRPSARSTVRLTELFDQLVSYRNREIGHGAAGARNREFYDRMARALLAGLVDILRKLDVLAGRRMVYVADVRRLASGKWLIERLELQGPQARRMQSLEVTEARTECLPQTEHLYLVPPDAADPACRVADAGLLPSRLLHPLLVYDPDLDETYFLNGRQGQRKVEYLGYTTGKARREVLAADQRQLLARVLGTPVNEEALGHWAAKSMAEDPPAVAEPAGVEPRCIGEFELLSRIGQGGMGTVYRAWQPSLGRQVALKRLIKFGDPKAQQRFQREIRVLGSVEHPHLVKIFTSGSDGDDQFFAMELIEGTDLGDVCSLLQNATAAEVDQTQWQAAVSTACQQARTREHSISESRHEGCRPLEAAPPQPSGDSDGRESRVRPAGAAHDMESASGSAHTDPVAVINDHSVPDKPAAPTAAAASSRSRRGAPLGSRGYIEHVVEIVRQVAQATHALHEHGVVHRDIKPGNIMLTEEGHAVLMDLGLAQLADDAEGRMTRTGQFVGTVRYASPEQLLSVMRLDRRSDVYSLGATMWELLTLRAMFGADDQMPIPDLMLKVQSVDPERPRRFNPRIPTDLQAIVLKCLEKDRSRRYATAGDLAADLARWQSGEPVLAQPASLGYMLGKYVRRHRGKVAAALTLLLLIVAGSAAAFLWVNAARREAITANQRLRDANEEVRQSRDVAQQQADLALRTLEGVIFDIQRKLDNVPAAQEAQRSMLETALDGLKRVARSVDSVAALDRNALVAHHDLGDIFFRVGGPDGTEQARQQFARSLALAERLAAAAPRDPQALRDLAVMHSKMGNVQTRLGTPDEAQKHYRESLEIRGRLAALQPDDSQVQRDLSVAHNKLGDVYLQLGTTEQAREHYGKSLAIRELLAKSNPNDPMGQRDLAVSYFNLGDIQVRLGSTKQAHECFQKYEAICERLALAEPQDARAQRDLALAYSRLSDLDLLLGTMEPARQRCQKCLEVFERSAAADPNDAQTLRGLAMAHLKLGDAFWQSAAAEQAGEHYQRYCDISERLAASDPSNTLAQRNLATAYIRLGDVELVRESTNEARRCFEKCQEITERLAVADPENTGTQWQLAILYSRLGDVDLQAGALQQALANYQKSMGTCERLAASDAQNAEARRAVAIGNFKLGDAHLRLAATEPARAHYQKYLEISQQLAKADPSNAQLTLDIAIGFCKLGQVSERDKEDPQAARWHTQGLELLQRLDQEHRLPGRPEDAGTLFDVARSYGRAHQLLDANAQPSPEHERAKEEFTEKTLAAVRYAVTLGYRKLDRLQNEQDLQSIRKNPRYQEVLAGLEGKTAKSESGKSDAP